MENLIIEETKYTPAINLDAKEGIFSISGKSYPENTFEFYKPMMDWAEEYFNDKNQDKTVVNIEIIYFNSSSSKLFFDFFDVLDESHNNGKDINVNWIYDKDNEAALEAGEDFKEDFEGLSFTLLQK